MDEKLYWTLYEKQYNEKKNSHINVKKQTEQVKALEQHKANEKKGISKTTASCAL